MGLNPENRESIMRLLHSDERTDMSHDDEAMNRLLDGVRQEGYAAGLRAGSQNNLSNLADLKPRLEQAAGLPLNASAILAANGEVCSAFERLIAKDVANFIARRDGGSSASMNGALDYTASTLLGIVRKALGVPDFPN